MEHITVNSIPLVSLDLFTKMIFTDPGVGLTACGTQFTAEDYIVAMV